MPAAEGDSRPSKWEKVWEIFEEVADLPPAEAATYLDEACDGDPVIRQAVEDMIAADRTTEGAFLDRPILQNPEASGKATDVRPTVRSIPTGVPKRIGPYELQHKVGEGGMSSVFLAVRDDDTYQRQVVVKIVRPGMENEHVVQRLRIERQILASLDHPNIARLFDGGSTVHGLPYFVMEYVDGMPVDSYCERNELSVEERLRVFLKICDAVHFAHRNLVIHRDIKPSNILVNVDGEPKLLDFGIAKLLNPDLGSPEIAPTITATRMLTPSYASPEQILGKMITTSSDVYSLGVLLYKLLTHTLPYDFTKRTAIEIEQLITGTEPRKPSQVATRPSTDTKGEAVDTGKVRRQLVGDLDAIVLKALRSAPQQRYAGVDHFAADIERFLKGQPVEARRGSRRYRLGKFVSRNRVSLSVITLVTALLLNFSWALARQNAKLEFERDQARIERDQKQQVLSIFEKMVFYTHPYIEPGQKMTMEDVLTHSLSAFDSGLEEQPQIRAHLLHTTGSMLERLGNLKDARRHLEEALSLRRELHGDESLEVAESLWVTGRTLSQAGRYEMAGDAVDEGLQLVSKLEDRESAERLKPLQVALLNEKTGLFCHQGQYDEAEKTALEANRLISELGAERTLQIETAALSANVHHNLGDHSQAVFFWRQALALQRELLGERHPAQISLLSNLGVDLRWLGELDAAERIYEEALGLTLEAYGENHQLYSMLLNNLAGARFARADYAAALESYAEVSELFRKNFGDAHWRNFHLSVNTEAARIRAGDPEPAERRLRSALGLWYPKLGDDHWLVHHARSVLGEALFAQGKMTDAEPLLTEGFLKVLESGAQHRYQKQALERLSLFLDDRGRAGEIAAFAEMIAVDSAVDARRG